ncbi:MAG TPA: hypothetical protein VIY49_25060 [Bryobacteraceae bacterium]
MSRQNEAEWNEAKRRCRLTDEEVRMAKDLGFQPKSLIKNIPSRSQHWKAPVNEWVRSLHEQKFGSRAPASAAPPAGTSSVAQQGEERRNAEDPWPDRPEIADLARSTWMPTLREMNLTSIVTNHPTKPISRSKTG